MSGPVHDSERQWLAEELPVDLHSRSFHLRKHGAIGQSTQHCVPDAANGTAERSQSHAVRCSIAACDSKRNYAAHDEGWSNADRIPQQEPATREGAVGEQCIGRFVAMQGHDCVVMAASGPDEDVLHVERDCL